MVNASVRNSIRSSSIKLYYVLDISSKCELQQVIDRMGWRNDTRAVFAVVNLAKDQIATKERGKDAA